MSKTKLRPCPFCGEATDLTTNTISGVRVTCDCCGAEGPSRKTVKAARDDWNDRIGSDINDQIGCLYEIRRLLGDKEGKLMQSEVVDRIKLALFDVGHLEARIILFATHVESLNGGASLANEMREFVNKRVTARKQRREAAKGEK